MADDKQLAQDLEALKQRLQVLEDKEAIRDVLTQYSLNADLDRTDTFLKLWTEDGTFDLGPQMGIWHGRDQIKQHVMNAPFHRSITTRSQHLMLDFEIDVDGDTATAAGYVLITVRWQAGWGIARCVIRTFRFRRVKGHWLIQESVSRETGDPECQKLIPPE